MGNQIKPTTDRIILLTGTHGTGKSTLITQAIHLLHPSYQHHYFSYCKREIFANIAYGIVTICKYMIQHNIAFENPENHRKAIVLQRNVEKCLYYQWYSEIVDLCELLWKDKIVRATREKALTKYCIDDGFV